jgi:hypothetical protein
MQIAIPKSLWDTFQATFIAEGKKICRDLAPILKVSEKELVQKLLTNPPKLPLAIIEDQDRPLSCPVLLKKAALYERCRLPCVLGTSRCCGHQTVDELPEVSDEMTHLTRLQRTDPAEENYWCDENTGDVYNRQMCIVGEYKDEVLTLFSYGE